MINNTNIDKISIGDIDIDTADRTKIINIINHIPAQRMDGEKHPTGVYVQDIPIDPTTGYAEDSYEDSKYTKIDFINLGLLKNFNSNEEISELMDEEPDWDLLKIPEIVEQLPQIHSHYDLVQESNPGSLEDLVSLLHKIREGSQYTFKKCHAIAYALNIILMMNYFKKTNHLPSEF